MNIYNKQKNLRSTKFFKYLSYFIEKYDKKLFSHEIKNKFIQLADILAKPDSSELAQKYFKHIIFNPKIFLKFNISLQVNNCLKID